MEPLNLHAGVVDWSEPGFKVGEGILSKNQILEGAEELRWLVKILLSLLLSPCPAQTLQGSNSINGSLHTSWQLRVKDDVSLSRAGESGGGDGLAERILRSACVLASIFRIDRRDFQDYKPKVTEGTDA